MATLNVSNFEFELIKKIRNTIDDKELAILHKALNVLKTGAIFTVIQFSDLPDASENVGKLYFVKNDSILYFSFISSYRETEIWIPITNMTLNTLWSWGANPFGQLGDGTTVSRCSPGTIFCGGTTWCQISSSSNASFTNVSSAIKTDGTLWTWGFAGGGQLGDGTLNARCSPGTVAGGGTTWCQVSMSVCFAAAIKTDGTLWTWGSNLQGRLGDGTTVSRRSPGTIFGGGTNWCQVSTGPDTGAISAIKTDGTLWTWGSNIQGRLGDGTVVSRCSPGTVAGGGTTWCQVSMSMFAAFTTAIKTDGTLWTWGYNAVGNLGDGTTVPKCSPGTIAGGGTTWCQVSGVGYHTAAIKTDGTLWTWGRGGSGQLGNGTTINKSSPGTVSGSSTMWSKISGARYHSSAIKTDGTLWTWGGNASGVLGDGTTVDRCSPGTIFGGGTNWFLISNILAITKETL